MLNKEKAIMLIKDLLSEEGGDLMAIDIIEYDFEALEWLANIRYQEEVSPKVKDIFKEIEEFKNHKEIATELLNYFEDTELNKLASHLINNVENYRGY